MKFTVENYEDVAEAVSARIVRMVLNEIKKQDSTATLEDAEKAIKIYFDRKITGRIDCDRLFFLKLPNKLQDALPNEDDYGMVLNAYDDAFLMGYMAGMQDLQELEGLIKQ